MRCLIITIGLLATPLVALALTWDFDEGNTWGWTAQESNHSSGSTGNVTTVSSQVEDGVWRIAPVPIAQRPAIQLRSPPIREDSALFDYVTLRLRIIHHRPTEGRIEMVWFNPEFRRLNAFRSLELWPQFHIGRNQIYLTEWQNITIDIRDLDAAPETEVAWQDTLFDFQIDLDLNTDPQGPADHPAFLEVDWIQLTGVEELLLGELQPRAIAVEAGLPGALLAEPDFFPLGEGIGDRSGLRDSPGALGDVDGDGDMDLVAVWERLTDDGSQLGWTIASNDGLGGFVPTRETTSQTTRIDFHGSDFDGDGLLDLVFSGDQIVEVWHNRGEDGFETALRLSGVRFFGLGDGDGDGDLDLLGVEYDDVWSNVIMWFNDGDDGFIRSDRFDLDSEEELLPYLPAGQLPGEVVRLLWNRPCYQPQVPWQLTRPWATIEESPLFFEAAVSPCALQLLVDLDGDGAVELVGSPEIREFFVATYHGLVLWRLDASGGVERHTLLGSQVLVSHRAIASDLDGDGLLDLAVVDGNLATGPALVVLVGQRNGVPVVEGRYPLPGVGSQVLAGDVNGDGATDLVVLGRSVEGGPGGAFVFLNQVVPAATAVVGETMATPAAFALGTNYPNPFNPATTIPVSVITGADDVDVTIYNVLGQPVRQVWNGPLAAGEHRLAWDGRDGQGQSVAAGVYVVRLQVADQTRIRKMVKLE